ncbi:MAG: bifunctional serine/threonine-protein kinase/formylglycine-generating enzyme family protein [Polyangiaceae bacterium]
MGGREPSLCHACNTPLAEGARFCHACATPVVAAPQSSERPVEATGMPATELDPLVLTGRFPPGTKLGVYRLEGPLGAGGMGVVYAAWDEARNRPVAIKCLHPNLVADPEVRRRFLREAKALRAFSHPGAAAIYDFLQDDRDVLGIVMERIDGLTLTRHIARWRGRVPWSEVHAIFGSILDAIEEAHASGIVHRDLKPDNVLVCAGGPRLAAKIVDFGIAKIREGTTFTVTGAFIGTCRYMAPEQVRAPQLADPRSDVYSLGVTLYELCTGRVPFDYPNHFALMMAQVHEAPAPPREHRADMPEALEALLLKALSKSPADRPATCRAFREELDAALAGVLPAHDSAADSGQRSTVVRDTDGYEMVLIPGGPFLMGADRRTVRLDPFYIDRVPVTNEQFATFLRATGYSPEGEGRGRFLMHLRDTQASKRLAKHPVVFVSWVDARAYAAWAGKRLPTEAEWEKAARGTDGRRYPWGREEPSKARALFGHHDGGTAQVGTFPRGASPYGVLDMAGNVMEWCDDADDPDFYADGPEHNPRNVGERDASPRVMRGGSFMHGAAALRATARTSFEPSYRFASGGFRCARSA